MKSLLVSAIVATAGLGASFTALSSPSDAQAQAAALLSSAHRHTSNIEYSLESASSQVNSSDAQAQAAALLRGVRATNSVASTPVQVARKSPGAQAQAAALLLAKSATTPTAAAGE